MNLNSDIFADFVFQNINYRITAPSDFSAKLKNANISPIYKKDSRNIVSNYRPVSILSNISKIYERCLFKQISALFEEKLSRF